MENKITRSRLEEPEGVAPEVLQLIFALEWKINELVEEINQLKTK